MLPADELQRRDDVTDARTLDVANVHQLEPIRGRHDVADVDLVMANPARLRKLYWSLAENVGCGEDAEDASTIIDDKQRAHMAAHHRPIGLVDRRRLENGYRADPAEVRHHLDGRRIESHRLDGTRQRVAIATLLLQ